MGGRHWSFAKGALPRKFTPPLPVTGRGDRYENN